MIFKSDDSTLIYYESRRLKKPKASLLLVHGLGEHSGRYSDFIKRAHKMGLDVHCIDLRGHGRSTGVRGHVDSFDQYYSDLEIWLQHLENSNLLRTDIPCFLFGHSLGGLIALNFLTKRKEIGDIKIAGLALSAPAFGLPSQLVRLQYQFSKKVPKILKSIHIPNGIKADQLSHDKAVIADYKEDPLVHHWVTPGFFQSYVDTVTALPKLIKNVKIPILVLAAGSDTVVSTEAILKFSTKLAVAHPDLVTTKVFHGFYHEIFNETKKDRADLFLKKWILACLSPKKKANLNLVSSRLSKKKATVKATLH